MRCLGQVSSVSFHAFALALIATSMLPACGQNCPSGYVKVGGYCRNLVDAATDAGDDSSASGGKGGAIGQRDSANTGAGSSAQGTGGDSHAGGTGGAGEARGGAGGDATAAGSGGGSSAVAGQGHDAAMGGGSGGASAMRPEPVCGNGVKEQGELCDGDCPSECKAAPGCMVSTLSGAANSCDAQCKATEISECKQGDGCCAKGCKYPDDDDCSKSCGDGVVDAPEICEAKSTDKPCPTSCDDQNACTKDVLTGSAEQCNAACSHTPVTAAVDGDGCCPSGANALTDSDCPTQCGDGVISGSETCDPKSHKPCPSSCDDGQACTADKAVGDAAKCSADCMHTQITAAKSGDGCCPDGANISTDDDCNARCGDGVVTGNEKCEAGSNKPCPSSCNDGDDCTTDTLTGSASDCSAACTYTAITRPKNDDGCCPANAGANANNDNDCSPVCGNGEMEAGEMCDPCPSACSDGNPCTEDNKSGSGCKVVCAYPPSAAGKDCGGGNVCSGSGACQAPPQKCGNKVREGDEQCDDGADTWECDGNCNKRKIYISCSVPSDCDSSQHCVDGACVSDCGNINGNLTGCPSGTLPAQAAGHILTCVFVNNQTGYCRPQCEADAQCPKNMGCAGSPMVCHPK